MKQIAYLFLFIPILTFAQSLNSSLGFAGFGDPVDGYYFSFDISFPISKSFEVAPTFTFASNTDFDHGKFFYRTIDGLLKEEDLENNRGRQVGTAEMFIYFKPLMLFHKDIDFKIGSGFGVSNHTYSFYVVDEEGNITLGSEYGLNYSFSLRIIYNYHIKNYYFGVVVGASDLISYGNSLIGMQFGISLDR